MSRVAIVSFRLGVPDGVSVVAGHWATGFERLGLEVRTLAGSGVCDRLLPGLAIDAPTPPTRAELARQLAWADLVVVEKRRRFAHLTGWPPDDPAWVHATINELSRKQLAARGIVATTVYGGFAVPPPGRHELTRRRLGVAPERRLLLQPTRAIARKNVPAGLAMAEAVGAEYWLTGPVEEGYGPELARILAGAACPVHRGIPDGLEMDDAYAAADAVVLPSTWEGFGAPLIEASMHRRPLAVGDYPVAAELAAFGFRWFPVHDPGPLRGFLDRPDAELLEHNREVAVRHFSLDALTAQLADLFHGAGWDDLLG